MDTCGLNTKHLGMLVVDSLIIALLIHLLEKEHQQTQKNLKSLCGGMQAVCGVGYGSLFLAFWLNFLILFKSHSSNIYIECLIDLYHLKMLSKKLDRSSFTQQSQALKEILDK